MAQSSINAAPVNQRSRRILYAIITEYIATGDAVGSRTLAKKYQLQLSPATIRNVMADLEEAGFLLQEHTSAGRVPTPHALRFFIDSLMNLQPLSADELDQIQARFLQLGPDADLLRISGQLLSEMTGTAALVVSPEPESRTLTQLRFLPTKPGELVAIMVLSDGNVENRFIRLEKPITAAELERVHNLLADVIEGRTLGSIRDLCARRLKDEKVRVDRIRHRAFQLGNEAVGGEMHAELVIEGQSRMLDHPELSDVSRLRATLLALEDRETLLSLLNGAVDARNAQVLVGDEMGNLAGGNLSVVRAPYQAQGHAKGSIGVVGMLRMDYSKVVPVVAATAAAMSEAFQRGEKGPNDDASLGAPRYRTGALPPPAHSNRRARRQRSRPLAMLDPQLLSSGPSKARLALPTRRATLRLGAALAGAVKGGELLLLEGQLGAGKTFLTRAILRKLGLERETAVTSPTFSLVHQYGTQPEVYHADLYRLGDASEIEDLGLGQARRRGALVIAEWARGYQADLGGGGLLLELSVEPKGRQLNLHAADEQAQSLLAACVRVATP